jgi:hypothetical protein
LKNIHEYFPKILYFASQNCVLVGREKKKKEKRKKVKIENFNIYSANNKISVKAAKGTYYIQLHSTSLSHPKSSNLGARRLLEVGANQTTPHGPTSSWGQSNNSTWTCIQLGPIKQLHMNPHPIGANQTTPHGPASNWGQSNNSTWTCIQLGPIKQLHMAPMQVVCQWVTSHVVELG